MRWVFESLHTYPITEDPNICLIVRQKSELGGVCYTPREVAGTGLGDQRWIPSGYADLPIVPDWTETANRAAQALSRSRGTHHCAEA